MGCRSAAFCAHASMGIKEYSIRRTVMRKIIVYNVISLDGYHTGLGNDVSVMFPMMGNVFDTYNA